MGIIGNRAQALGIAPAPLPDDLRRFIAEQEAREAKGVAAPIREDNEDMSATPRMGIIGASAPVSAITAPDVNQRIAAKRPGWNEPGGLGEGFKRLAASFMEAGGNSEGSNNILRDLQTEQERRDAEEHRTAQSARQNRPEGVSLGNGAYGQYDPVSGSLKMLREPTPVAPRQTPLERNIELYKRFNPNATDAQIAEMVQRGAGGFQYSQPYLEQKNSLTMGQIRERSANSRRLKQIPSYANLHPRPLAPRPARSAPAAKASTPSSAVASVAEGTIIRNPSTGQRMRMQGGTWALIK